MKRSKRLMTLAGILLAVCLVTFGVSTLEKKKEEIKNAEEIILEVPADSVNSLSWTLGTGEPLSFHKEEQWLYDEDTAFPVDEEHIQELLGQFEQLSSTFIIENAEDIAQYGLDKPVCTIQLATDSENHEIKLGAFSAMDSQRYLSIGDENVYLVSQDPMEKFDILLDDMMKHDDPPELLDSFAISFQGENGYDILRNEENTGKTYREDDIFFAEKNGEQLPLSTSNVNSYLRSIDNLSLTEYKTYTATEEDLAVYGLDDPDLIVTAEYIETDEEENETEKTFTLTLSRDPQEKKAAEEAKAAGEETDSESEEITAYVRVGDSSIIYQIDQYDYETLTSYQYDDLRHKEVLPADYEDISQMDVTLDGKTYTLTSEEAPLSEDGEEQDRIYSYQGEELDMGYIKSYLNSLKALSFTDEQPSDKLEISMTFTLALEGEPKIKMDIYRIDGEECLAVVDGTPFARVDRKIAVELIEQLNTIVLTPAKEDTSETPEIQE